MSTVKTSSGLITLSDGAEVFYEQAGTDSGRTLLCLPGTLCPGRMVFWYTLENFSKDFNVVTYDPRGYGKSQETKREFSPSVYHQDARDVAEVMKKLGYDKYSVVGVSSGAQIGLILAGKHPSCVEKLITFGGNAFICQDDMVLKDAAFSNIELTDEAMQHLKPFFEMYGEERYMKLTEEWVKNERAICERPGGDVCISEVKAITCPTLIIHGEREQFITRSHPDFLHENIPNSTLHIVPNEGHEWPLISYEEFHRMIKEFLEENVSSDTKSDVL